MSTEQSPTNQRENLVEQLLNQIKDLDCNRSYKLNCIIAVAFILFLVLIIAMSFISIINSFDVSSKTYVLLLIILTSIVTCILVLRRLHNLFLDNGELIKRIVHIFSVMEKEKNNNFEQKHKDEIVNLQEKIENLMGVKRNLQEDIKNQEMKFQKEKESWASDLNEFASMLIQANRLGDAKKKYLDAIDIYENLANITPTLYSDKWVTTLENYVSILEVRDNQKRQASRTVNKALVFYTKLAKADSVKWNPYYVRVNSLNEEIIKKVNQPKPNEEAVKSVTADSGQSATADSD